MNGEMNETITIDGKDYDVLTLDRISEITHAKMGGGDIVESEYNDLNDVIYVPFKNGDYRLSFGHESIRFLGIQPLKLIERKPVKFEAWTAIVSFHGNDVVAIICPETVHIDTKFQCVAVNK